MASRLNRQGSISKLTEASVKQGVVMHDVDKGMPCYACNTCPGFELHFWRKSCRHCQCSKGSHGFKQASEKKVGKLSGIDEFNKQLADDASRVLRGLQAKHREQREARNLVAGRRSSQALDGSAARQIGSEAILAKYAWVPDGLNDDQIERYMSTIPLEKRPLIGSDGEFYRIRQLETQLPHYDMDINSTSGLTTAEEKKAFLSFIHDKVEGSSDTGVVIELKTATPCFKCAAVVNPGELCVMSDRVKVDGQPAIFHHDTCFVCEICEELLVDLFCFVYEGDRLMCGRHWSDMHRARCTTCDETIFAEELTFTDERYFHLQHFCCEKCDQHLADKEYISVHNKPYCVKCYEQLHAEKCMACEKPIEVTSGKVSDGKGSFWHTKCFACCTCGESLEGRMCVPRDGKLYCREDFLEAYQKLRRKSQRRKPEKKTQPPAAGPAKK